MNLNEFVLLKDECQETSISFTSLLDSLRVSSPVYKDTCESMKWILSFLTLITAIVLYSDTIICSLRSILQDYQIHQNTTTTGPSPSFEGLPLIPDISIAKTDMSIPRTIRKAFLAAEQSEGMGARVRRSIGTHKLRNFSPFLMLDHFTVSPPAGFPDHPHRGQETITYLLEGGIDHEDFAGNAGTIGPGDLQFMTAGKGIMHAEMPHHNPDGSANVGLQLWVDLPEKLKFCEPRYRDLRASEIPAVDVDDDRVHIKVISGQSHGVDSVKELAYTPVWLLDINIKPGGKVTLTPPSGWNAFAYSLSGTTSFGSGKDQATVEPFHNVVFEQTGDFVEAQVEENAKEDGHFVLIAGQPLDQKVVQYGPFVLNNQDQVYQAMMDFQTHSNGFERGKGWRSEIGKGAY